MACGNCEVLPGPLPARGTLYLAPPLAHTAGKLRQQLRDRSLQFDEPSPGVLRVALLEGALVELASWLEKSLSSLELQDTRSLFCAEGVVPGLGQLIETDRLTNLLGRLRGDWLIELLERNALRTHFQPIVRAKAPKQIFGYECLLRAEGKEGQTIGAPALLDAGRAAGLSFQLDRAARLKAIEQARTFNVKAQLFINFLPTAIYEPSFCLRSTIEAIDRAQIAPSQVVFEVVESEELTDPNHLLNIMRHYRERGFRVALDDMGAGYSSLNLLSRLKPDFLKLDMELVRNVDSDPYKANIARKLLELCRDLGIVSLGEGVETPAELDWLQSHGVELVQGWLFAKAATPPPTFEHG